MPAIRILYVEDNFSNRLLVKRVLEAEGFTVLEAETGRDGINSALHDNPDLILVDINLPDIDGYAITGRLRKDDKIGKKIPIIALTANALHGDRQRALDAGCDGYIPKPIDIDLLPIQLMSYLRKVKN